MGWRFDINPVDVGHNLQSNTGVLIGPRYLKWNNEIFKIEAVGSDDSWTGYYYVGYSPQGNKWWSSSISEYIDHFVSQEDYENELIKVL